MARPVTWHIDGLDFNIGDDSYGNLYEIQRERGWAGTGIVAPARTPRVARHGSYRSPVYRPGRLIELTGWVHCPTWEGRQAAEFRLAALCQDPDTLYPLTRSDHGFELVSYVELDTEIDPIIRDGGRVLDFTLQLASSDYRKFAATASTWSTGLAQPATGGILWNGTAGTTGLGYTPGIVYQNAPSVTGTVHVTNDGTAPADVIILINGPCVGPTITAGERVIQWPNTISLGSTLVIDTGAPSVTVNGANRGTELTRSDWFQVPAQGGLDITFTAIDPANSVGATMTVQVFDSYA